MDKATTVDTDEDIAVTGKTTAAGTAPEFNLILVTETALMDTVREICISSITVDTVTEMEPTTTGAVTQDITLSLTRPFTVRMDSEFTSSSPRNICCSDDRLGQVAWRDNAARK